MSSMELANKWTCGVGLKKTTIYFENDLSSVFDQLYFGIDLWHVRGVLYFWDIV